VTIELTTAQNTYGWIKARLRFKLLVGLWKESRDDLRDSYGTNDTSITGLLRKNPKKNSLTLNRVEVAIDFLVVVSNLGHDLFYSVFG